MENILLARLTTTHRSEWIVFQVDLRHIKSTIINKTSLHAFPRIHKLHFKQGVHKDQTVNQRLSYRKIKYRMDCNKLQEHFHNISAWSKDWLLDFSVDNCCSCESNKPNILVCMTTGSSTLQKKIIVSSDRKPIAYTTHFIRKAN